MGKYEGLDPKLKHAVFTRDNHRCRWCGRQRYWRGFDAHHIRYRRGPADDTLGNLITLCRSCHDFVHDSYRIPKQMAQEILFELTSTPVVTGLALLRQRRRPPHSKEEVGAVIKQLLGEPMSGRLLEPNTGQETDRCTESTSDEGADHG